jgi:UDPglucose 6-dehydrogenase
MTIATAVQQANYRQQDRFAEKVIKYYQGRDEDVQVGVWGLSFKARTDDVRESPAIRCVEEFIKAGLKVKAFDPEAMGEAKKVLPESVELVAQSYDVLEGSSGLIVLTDWQEFRTPDFDRIAADMNEAVIFDGRNLYDPAYIQKQGIEYHGIARGKYA